MGDNPGQSSKAKNKAEEELPKESAESLEDLDILAAHRAKLLEKAKECPTASGVYQMKDDHDQVIYIGKAKSLRSRVSSYFQAGAQHTSRVELMVSRVRSFEVILTETESEALILECTLIKKHKPRFNVRLRDDKSYPYIKVAVDEDFPRLIYTRRVLKDGARYFGPFPSAWHARQVVTLLNHTFKLRDCSDNAFFNRSRACLLYQIGQCSAPCVGKIEGDEYRDIIKQVVAILDGESSYLLDQLKEEMMEAAASEEFERAAELRDHLKSLEVVTETQAVADPGDKTSRIVVGVARLDSGLAHGTLLQIVNGQMIAIRHFHLHNADQDVLDTELMFEVLAQHFASKTKILESDIDESAKILVPEGATRETSFDLIDETFGVNVMEPETKVDHQLISVAQANASHALAQREKQIKGHGLEALEQIQQRLHLDRLPQRIECFDISNIQDSDAVASRVVFIDGAPSKDHYRRYKIRTVEGQNDFAMMKEVLERRFSKRDEAFPELVVVDGGKGQLGMAVQIIQELNVQGVAVVGLAKARTARNFKSKEVESSEERVFIPNRKNPVNLYSNMPAYRLLTHIRDEAHRFAITYHRKVRSKRTLGKT